MFCQKAARLPAQVDSFLFPFFEVLVNSIPARHTFIMCDGQMANIMADRDLISHS